MKRHPAAIARDAWFDTQEGKDSTDPLTLGAEAKQRQYLTNRLHSAFQAGCNAAEKIKQKEIDALAKKFADMMVYANQLEDNES